MIDRSTRSDELVVIGALLIGTLDLGVAVGELHADDFTDPCLGDIFSAMCGIGSCDYWRLRAVCPSIRRAEVQVDVAWSIVRGDCEWPRMAMRMTALSGARRAIREACRSLAHDALHTDDPRTCKAFYCALGTRVERLVVLLRKEHLSRARAAAALNRTEVAA